MIENFKVKTVADVGNFITTAVSDGDWRERISSLPTIGLELISEEEIEKFMLRIEDESNNNATIEDQRLGLALAESIIKNEVEDDLYILNRISRANCVTA